MEQYKKVLKTFVVGAIISTITAISVTAETYPTMVYDSGASAYKHSVSSSASCNFVWERTNATDISKAGKGIADFTYKWNKGGLTAPDSVTVEITKTYRTGNAVGAVVSITRTDGKTESGTIAETSKGSGTYRGTLWKETSRTSTKLTERLLSYYTTCSGS